VNKTLLGLFIADICWVVTIFAVKISILLVYLRLFGDHRRARRWIHALLGIAVCWAIVVVSPSEKPERYCEAKCVTQLFISIFRCKPVDNFWNWSSSYACTDAHWVLLGGSVPHVATDLIMLLLPVPLVWNMQLRWSQKLILCGIFGLGGL